MVPPKKFSREKFNTLSKKCIMIKSKQQLDNNYEIKHPVVLWSILDLL